MTKEREALKLALDALDNLMYWDNGKPDYDEAREAITAIKEALDVPEVGFGNMAQPEQEQEPLEYWNAVEGWVKIDEVRQHFEAVSCGTIYKTAGEGRVPLYTAPPAREWVGLTVEQIEDVGFNLLPTVTRKDFVAFARYVEMLSKEKNQ